MINYFLTILFSIPVILPLMDEHGYEINEGHLYAEERISKEKIWEVLDEDADQATNCFQRNKKDDESIEVFTTSGDNLKAPN